MPIDLSRKQSIEEITGGRIKKKPKTELPEVSKKLLAQKTAREKRG